MTYLLDIDHASIWQTCLICLAQNRVKRLAPVMARVQKGYRSSHHLLHAKYRVIWKSRRVEVRRFRPWNRGKNLQNGFRSHAPDREARTREVEFSGNQLPSHRGEHGFESVSEIGYHLMVIQGEPSIFISIWSPIVISGRYWLPVSRCLQVVLIEVTLGLSNLLTLNFAFVLEWSLHHFRQ